MGMKVVEKVLPMGTKWKDLLLGVNAISADIVLEPISLSKLSVIKKTNFNEYITKRPSDKFARCFKCKTLKQLWDAYTIET